MVKVQFLPSGKGGAWEPGESVLDTALRLGIDLGQQCGGRGTCGKCKVRIADGEADAPGALESIGDSICHGYVYRYEYLQHLNCSV